MSRKIDKPRTTAPRVAIFTPKPNDALGAAIAEGLGTEETHALAHSFALASADLVDGLPDWVVNGLTIIKVEEGQDALEVPEVADEIIEALMSLAIEQGRLQPPPGDTVEGENEQAAAVGEEDGSAEGVLPALVSDALSGDLWSKVAAGHVVLAPDYDEGEFVGFWLATVIRRTAKTVTLRWAGQYADQPEFTKPLTALALRHPACAVKQ